MIRKKNILDYKLKFIILFFTCVGIFAVTMEEFGINDDNPLEGINFYEIMMSAGNTSRPITLSPATPDDNFTVRLDLNSSFDYGSCLPGGDDIRFYDLSNNSLSYWIEDWNDGGNSTIWIKIPQSGTTSIRMEYEDAGASAASNGEDTFLFFDDFSGASLNFTKWEVQTGLYGHQNVTSGILYMTADPSPSMQLKTNFGFADEYLLDGIPSGGYALDMARFGGANHVQTVNNDHYGDVTNGTTFPFDFYERWFIAEVQFVNASSVKFYDDDSLITELTTYIPDSPMPISLGSRAMEYPSGDPYGCLINSTDHTLGQPGRAFRARTWSHYRHNSNSGTDDTELRFDWIFVRNCSSTEPVASIGSSWDDFYEENDDYTTAYNLSAYNATWLSTINGSGSQYDDDYFEIYVPSGYETVYVYVNFTHADGDIDVELCNSIGSCLEGSWGSTDTEEITYVVPCARTYFIYVYGPAMGNEYDLYWECTPQDDPYEENDDISSAYNLSAYENTWLSSILGKGINLDDDYYEIYVPSGSEYLEISIECDVGESMGVGVKIYNATQDLFYSSSWYEDVRVATPVGGGVYYIRPLIPRYHSVYDLIWNTTSLPLDDAYEENDEVASAYNLTNNEYVWLSGLSGEGKYIDEDYYEIYLNSSYPVLEVDINVSGGDIRLDFMNSPSGTLFMGGVHAIDRNITFRYMVSSPGSYYIRIYGPVAGTTYDMQWRALSIPSDDSYEDNDDPFTTTNLTSHAGTCLSDINGTAVLLDWDNYLVEVPSGHSYLYISLNFTQPPDIGVDVDIAVLDSEFFGIGMARSRERNSTDLGVFCSPGLYVVMVTSSSYYPSSGIAYDLMYTTSVAPTPSDDNYAINNDTSCAFNMSSYEGVWLSSINGTGLLYEPPNALIILPNDFYEIEVSGPVPERVHIELLSNLTKAPIQMFLVNYQYSVLYYPSFYAIEIKNNFTIETVLQPGTYYIQVSTNEPIGQEYDLMWTSTPVTTIPDDPIEIHPANGSTIPNDPITLQVNVTDPDGDNLNVYFYNASDDSLIGVNYGVPSGGTAWANFSGFVAGVPNTWYVVIKDDYLYRRSDNFTFTYLSTNNPPSTPTLQAPLNESVISTINAELIVQVSDPDFNSLDVVFYNASDDSVIGVVFGVTSGTNASITWLNLTTGANHSWYVEVGDGLNVTRSENFTFSVYVEPNEPSLVSPANGGRVTGGDQLLEVLVTHQGGFPMNVTFYNASDNSVIGTDLNVASGGIASITWSGLANGSSYSWYTIADDGSNQNQSITWTFDTNELPNAVLSSPLNDSRISLIEHLTLGTLIEVNISDPEGDIMDVYYYNASNDALIGMDLGVASGTTASFIVPPVMLGGETLSWYVIVNDGYGNITFGSWQFTLNNLQNYFMSEPANGSRLTLADVKLQVFVEDLDSDVMDIYFYNASDDSLIGINASISSFNNASILWSSLSPGITYTWYVVFDDGYDLLRTENSSFSINGPPSAVLLSPLNNSRVSLIDYIIVGTTIEVNVSDPENDAMDVYFYNASDDALIGVDLGVPSGTTATMNVPSGMIGGETLSWYVTIDDGYDTTTEGTWLFTLNQLQDYNLTAPVNSSVVTETDVVLGVDIIDFDGDAMDVYFYDASDDSLIDVDLGVISGNTASISWISLTPGMVYEWYAMFDDGYDLVITENFTFRINDAPAAAFNPTPANSATGVGLYTMLSVDVTDPDGDNLTATFYNATDDSIIDTMTGIPSGSSASIPLTGLLPNTSYGWYVETDDGFNATNSSTWTFTTSLDDMYEDNDAMGSAYNLSSIEGVYLSDYMGYGVQSDDDWFEIQVSPGFERVIIDVYFSHADGNIDLELYNASGGFIWMSWSTDDNEHIDFTVPAPGTYYIYLWWGNGGNIYDLVWTAIPPSEAPYLMDAPSPMNNTVLGETDVNLTATVADPEGDLMTVYFVEVIGLMTYQQLFNYTNVTNETTVSYIWTGRTPGVDYNWTVIITDGSNWVYNQNYTFHVNTIPTATLMSPSNNSKVASGDTANLSVTMHDIEGDLMTVYFRNASDDSLIDSVTGITDGGLATVNWTGLTSGDHCSWYIEVDDGINTTNIGTWNFDVNTPPNPANNELPSNGTAIVETSPLLFVNVSDPDGDTLNVYFYDALFDSLIGSDISLTNGSQAYTTWSSLLPGYWYEWYVIISDGVDNTTTGNFTFYVNTPPDAPTNPQPADSSIIYSTSINLSVNVSDYEGDLMDVTFYNASDDSIIGTINSALNESIASIPWSGLERGVTHSWYVSIDDWGNQTNSTAWSFTVSIDDAYEENDVMGSAYNLSSQEGVLLSSYLGNGIQSDDDWFEIQVAPGNEYLIVDVLFNHSEGDIDVTVYNASGDLVYLAVSVDDNEHVEFNTGSAGTYYILVYWGNASNTYDLIWTTMAPSLAPYLMEAPLPGNNTVVGETDVTLSVRVADPEGDLMTVYFVEVIGLMTYQPLFNYTNVTNETVLSYTWTGRTRGVDYNWTVIISDGQNMVYNPNYTFHVNTLPTATLVSPANNTVVSASQPANLSVTLNDIDGDSMTVYFRNASDDNLIASQIGVDSGNTVSANWSGLIAGAHYSWYVEVNDGLNTSIIGTWHFDVNNPPDPAYWELPSNGSRITDIDPWLWVGVSDADGDTMDVYFYNAASDFLIGSDLGNANGSAAYTVWSGRIRGLTYSWYVIISDGLDNTTTGNFTFYVNTIPIAPSIPLPADFSIISGNSTNLSVYVYDMDGDILDVTFYNAFDDSIIGINYSVASSSTASMEWLGLVQGITYNWYVEIDDGLDAINSTSWSFKVNTIPDYPILRGPGISTVSNENTITLQVVVNDPDLDTLTVTFYDAWDGSIISTVENISGRGIASVTWDDLTPGESYKWFVIINDGYDLVVSPIWDFSVASPSQFNIINWMMDNPLILIAGTAGICSIVVAIVLSKRKKASKALVKKKPLRKDLVAPPADLVAPPADLVAPPADLVAPPADLVAPPSISPPVIPLPKEISPATHQPEIPSPWIPETTPTTIKPKPPTIIKAPSTQVKPKAPAIMLRPNRMCSNCGTQYTVQESTSDIEPNCPNCSIPLTKLGYCPNCKNPLVLSAEYLAITKGKDIICPHCSKYFDLEHGRL